MNMNDKDDVHVAGRRMIVVSEDDQEDGITDDGSGYWPGPTGIVQKVTAGRNATVVSGDYVIRNEE
jgi:hypothetical protein